MKFAFYLCMAIVVSKCYLTAKRCNQLQARLEDDLSAELWNQILEVDVGIAEKWGYICAQPAAKLHVADSLLAATALTHNLIAATRNVKDFAPISGLEIFNPWNYA